jgi:hypothetical protein
VQNLRCLIFFIETYDQNAPGSFALFGGNAAAKTFMGVGEDGQQATWAQNAMASSAGAVASISVAQPLDVIKVSKQTRAHIRLRNNIFHLQ